MYLSQVGDMDGGSAPSWLVKGLGSGVFLPSDSALLHEFIWKVLPKDTDSNRGQTDIENLILIYLD